MIPSRTLTATAVLFAANAAHSGGYDDAALLYLQGANPPPALETPADDPAENLKAIAEASTEMEWHEGEDGTADSMTMVSDVLFGFGTAELTPKAVATLESVAADLIEVGSVEIHGHTDSIGSEAHNRDLAEARAAAVKDWLVAQAGADPAALTVISRGEAEPIAANAHADGSDNPEGRALNRRVAFHFPETEAVETTALERVWPATSNAI